MLFLLDDLYLIIRNEEYDDKDYQLFFKHGYNNVTINDICKECKITKPTFYTYIKSKDDILAHFYDDITEAIVANTANIIMAENYWQQLLICFETLMEESIKLGYDLSSQMFIMNLKEDRGSFDFRDHLTNIAIAIIKKGQATKQIRNQNNPEILYQASAYAFTGYELMWCIKKGQFDWKKELRIALENIYDVAPELRG